MQQLEPGGQHSSPSELTQQLASDSQQIMPVPPWQIWPPCARHWLQIRMHVPRSRPCRKPQRSTHGFAAPHAMRLVRPLTSVPPAIPPASMRMIWRRETPSAAALVTASKWWSGLIGGGSLR
jgi:hypothetical protein